MVEEEIHDTGEVKLSYLDNQVNSNITLVLLHGWLDSKLHFIKMIPLLQNYRVIALDLRGHGKSEKPRSEYNINEFITDVDNFLQWLRSENTPQNLFVSGHSMSGLIVQKLVTKVNYIDGCILMNSSASITANPYAKYFGWGFKLLIRLHMFSLAKVSRVSLNPSASREIVKIEENAIRETPAYVAKKSYRNIILKEDLRDNLQDIAIPVLIIAGELDMATPASHSRYMAKHIPDATHYVLPYTAHLSMLEHPQIMSNILSKFMDEHSKRV